MSEPLHTLVLGGARSGKSGWAQRLAESLAGDRPGRLVYLATGQARDPEMARRVALHQTQRGPLWSTREEPLEVAAALQALDRPGAVILLDCLTMWLSNLMTAAGLDQDAVARRGQELADLVPGLQARLILVGNEVGMGIVPENALARAFRDQAGLLHQRLAAVCGRVVLVAAGLPLALKGGLPG
ncbi:MAG: bifunctional adenosylcobinamide kinase/adenosylcobinamide-phosphate guanylyltransferase [Thermodesulfobacteriota bacterium]